MSELSELQEKRNNIKAAIANKATPDNIRGIMESKLPELEKQIADAEGVVKTKIVKARPAPKPKVKAKPDKKKIPLVRQKAVKLSLNEQCEAIIKNALTRSFGAVSLHIKVFVIIAKALTDANYHKQSKRVWKVYDTEEKFAKSVILDKSVEILEDAGVEISQKCDWTIEDIIAAFKYYFKQNGQANLADKLDELDKEEKTTPTIPYTPHKYHFYEDPGHGWMEVPKSELKALGIEQEISGFSYQKGLNAYLEEDSDRTTFVKAGEAAGWFDIKDVLNNGIDHNTDNDSPVRNYAGYVPPKKEFVKALGLKKSGFVEAGITYPHPYLKIVEVGFIKGGDDEFQRRRNMDDAMYDLSGDSNKSKRQEILSMIRGEKVPVAKCGIGELGKEFWKWIYLYYNEDGSRKDGKGTELKDMLDPVFKVGDVVYTVGDMDKNEYEVVKVEWDEEWKMTIRNERGDDVVGRYPENELRLVEVKKVPEPKDIVSTKFADRYGATTEELIADYKYQGLDNKVAWSKFIIDRNLTPGIDAKDFYKIWQTVSPRKLVGESSTVSFKATHYDTVRKGYVQNTQMDGYTKHLWEDGSTGSSPDVPYGKDLVKYKTNYDKQFIPLNKLNEKKEPGTDMTQPTDFDEFESQINGLGWKVVTNVFSSITYDWTIIVKPNDDKGQVELKLWDKNPWLIQGSYMGELINTANVEFWDTARNTAIRMINSINVIRGSKEVAKDQLKGYAKSIVEDTGCDPADAAEIEDIMRNDIFHSTLDWQSRAEFKKGAIEAYEQLKFMRSPEGIEYMAKIGAEMDKDAFEGKEMEQEFKDSENEPTKAELEVTLTGALSTVKYLSGNEKTDMEAYVAGLKSLIKIMGDEPEPKELKLAHPIPKSFKKDYTGGTFHFDWLKIHGISQDDIMAMQDIYNEVANRVGDAGSCVLGNGITINGHVVIESYAQGSLGLEEIQGILLPFLKERYPKLSIGYTWGNMD